MYKTVLFSCYICVNTNIKFWFNTYSCEYVWEIWCLVTKIYRKLSGEQTYSIIQCAAVTTQVEL